MTYYLDFTGPAGLRTRGTVLVLPGRGESAWTYNRFGARIAADAYRVRVLPELPPAESASTALKHLDDELVAALSGVADELVRPLVLVGSDAAAATLAALVAGGSSHVPWWPDALVLAGLPGYGSHHVHGGWESELDVRSHCPAHRDALSNDERVRRGSLSAAVDNELLDLAYGSTTRVPHLLLAGDSDPLADRESLARMGKSLPVARFSVVRSAHHEVLNDLQHRSVAAEVVSFLEVVRNGRPLEPIVIAESSAW
jgi:pimeloyl-ACP methyl ester carboxylesterase